MSLTTGLSCRSLFHHCSPFGANQFQHIYDKKHDLHQSHLAITITVVLQMMQLQENKFS